MILAAFRPDTKARLVEEGLLAPTVQFVFRRSQRSVLSRDDYMSGRRAPVGLPALRDRARAHGQPRQRHRPRRDPAAGAARGARGGQAARGRRLLRRRACRSSSSTPRRRSAASGAARPIPAGCSSRPRTPPTRTAGRSTSTGACCAATPIGCASRRSTAAGGRRSRSTGRTRARSPRTSPVLSARVDIGVFADNGVHDSAPAIVSLLLPAPRDPPLRARRRTGASRIAAIDHADPGKAGLYLDPMLMARADWRDDYAYDADGRLAGWRRPARRPRGGLRRRRPPDPSGPAPTAGPRPPASATGCAAPPPAGLPSKRLGAARRAARASEPAGSAGRSSAPAPARGRRLSDASLQPAQRRRREAVAGRAAGGRGGAIADRPRAGGEGPERAPPLVRAATKSWVAAPRPWRRASPAPRTSSESTRMIARPPRRRCSRARWRVAPSPGLVARRRRLDMQICGLPAAVGLGKIASEPSVEPSVAKSSPGLVPSLGQHRLPAPPARCAAPLRQCHTHSHAPPLTPPKFQKRRDRDYIPTRPRGAALEGSPAGRDRPRAYPALRGPHGRPRRFRLPGYLLRRLRLATATGYAV